jgi:signal transduction histidine kinase
VLEGRRALSEELRLHAVIRPELKIDSEAEGSLEPEVVGHILQIAHAAITNVIRHAEAIRVEIRLFRAGDRVVRAIRDNGRGFDAEAAERRGGDGLPNMAGRASRIGGRLVVSSSPAGGTEVRLELPRR